MRLVADLSAVEIQRALRGSGLRVATGPFNCVFRSDIPLLAEWVGRLYTHHALVPDAAMIDFYVELAASKGLRRWFRPQASFLADDVAPFTPLPVDQALPMLEWGLNWCICAYSHHVLILHAACVARDGRALILPAPPGSGKSTLCAALVNRGWRLLSDELTLIDFSGGVAYGLARPVNLKNASIDVIRRFAPDAVLSRVVHDTTKGSVALMAPTAASVRSVNEPAAPAWVVLPKYCAGARGVLQPMGQAETFMQLVDNAMNYALLGQQGFQTVGALVGACRSFRFEYGDLEAAMRTFDALAEDRS